MHFKTLQNSNMVDGLTRRQQRLIEAGQFLIDFFFVNYSIKYKRKKFELKIGYNKITCGTKFLRAFIFTDWRFFVFCGK